MPVNRAKFHFDHTYSDMDARYGPYILYQVGDLSCAPGYQTYEHEQAVYEIVYVLSGSGSFYVNDQICKMEKDDLLIIRKGDRHNIVSSENDPLRFFYLGFDFLDPLLNDSLIPIRDFFVQTERTCVQNAVGIQDIFVKMLSEFLSEDAVSVSMVEAYIQEILCTVYRAFHPRLKRNYILNSDNTDEKLVYDVIHYIDANLETMENLMDLSEVFGYTYTHIAQRFFSVTGERLKQYHTKRRFQKANDYLRQGYSITKVAELMGYKSIHTFSRAYKNHLGVAPREYKKWTEDDRRIQSQSE